MVSGSVSGCSGCAGGTGRPGTVNGDGRGEDDDGDADKEETCRQWGKSRAAATAVLGSHGWSS